MSKRKKRPLRYRGVNIGSAHAPARGRRADGELAPWSRRVLAYLVDTAVILAGTAGLYYLLRDKSYFGHMNPNREHFARTLAVALAAALYYPPLMRFTNGRTLGMLLLGIRVVRANGKPMTVALAFWRQVVVMIVAFDAIDYIPVGGIAVGTVLVFLDALYPLWDREKRALHDMLAGTRVRWAGEGDCRPGQGARRLSQGPARL